MKIMKKKYMSFLSGLIALCLILNPTLSVFAGNSVSDDDIRYRDTIIKAADFILSLQCSNGAIKDSADTDTVNTDSNMEYALMGLGAAYRMTYDKRYLLGLKKGIGWLAAAECMSDRIWKGSWWYSYSTSGKHRACPDGNDILDVRGVDTTSALFVYLLYLDKRLDPDSSLYDKYRKNAEAAVRFIEVMSIGKDGLSWSSYQKYTDKKWHIYECKYSSDQGDVYLGMEAAGQLYSEGGYTAKAEKIKDHTQKAFFSAEKGRYCVSIENGVQNWETDSFDPIQSQGFLPWMWGSDAADNASATWLLSCVQSDGSISCFSGDPEYAMSAAILGMAMNGTGGKAPAASYSWIKKNLLDSSTGGIKDSMSGSEETCNVAGFMIIAMSGMLPFGSDRIWGVTINNVSDVNAVSLDEIITALDAMDKMPTVRIVMNPERKASDYREIIEKIHRHAYVMLCPCDSSYISSYVSAGSYVARFKECDRELSPYVDIWEIGNEINGEGWLGISTKKAAQYMYSAWKYIYSKGYVTELTPYDFRSGDQTISMMDWLKKYVPDDMKKHVDHVLISYYDDDNGGIHDDWNETFSSLKAMFPNSYVGFGECGFSEPHVYDDSFALQVSNYYGLPQYNDHYEGGYFWWYWQEDCVPYQDNKAWQCINDAIGK